MREICLEKLPAIFLALQKRDQILLGEYYGVYGHEKQSVSELALDMELTIDGVYKARDAALARAKKIYRKSNLYIWRKAYVDTKITALKGK